MLGPAGYLILGLLCLLGARLIALAVRTRKLPELWIGLFFMLTAPGGGLVLRALELVGRSPAARVMAVVGLCLVALGTVPGYIFTYTVFRPGRRWALGLAVAGSVLCLWGCFAQLGGLSLHIDASGPRMDFVLARVVCFGWSTYESLRLYFMMKRRLAVGLGDPVVGNRFLLFAWWSTAMGVLPLTHALDRLLGGAAGYRLLLTMLPKTLGAFMFVAIFLNFFPPRAYLAWLRRSGAGESGV
jgi:hypothetical protein